MATIIWEAQASLINFKRALEEARRYYALTPDQESVVQTELANVEASWARIHAAFYAPGATLTKREQPPEPERPPMTVPQIVNARRGLVCAGVRPYLAEQFFPFPAPK